LSLGPELERRIGFWELGVVSGMVIFALWGIGRDQITPSPEALTETP